MTLEDRFWSKVEPTGFCWLWTAALRTDGYGVFQTKNRGGIVRAHRYAYELLIGKIPSGLQIDHLCRVKRCVNPDHLEAVTAKENTRRAFAARAPIARCKRGHEFTPSNTHTSPTTGSRTCRACLAVRQKAYYERKKRT
jgi:hypothetical protein